MEAPPVVDVSELNIELSNDNSDLNILHKEDIIQLKIASEEYPEWSKTLQVLHISDRVHGTRLYQYKWSWTSDGNILQTSALIQAFDQFAKAFDSEGEPKDSQLNYVHFGQMESRHSSSETGGHDPHSCPSSLQMICSQNENVLVTLFYVPAPETTLVPADLRSKSKEFVDLIVAKFTSCYKPFILQHIKGRGGDSDQAVDVLSKLGDFDAILSKLLIATVDDPDPKAIRVS